MRTLLLSAPRRAFRLPAVLVALACLMGLPAAAQASAVQVSDGTLYLTAASLQTNDYVLKYVQNGAQFNIFDSQNGLVLAPGAITAGCLPQPNNSVDCPSGTFSAVIVESGDLNDNVSIIGFNGDTFTVNTLDGNDHLSVPVAPNQPLTTFDGGTGTNGVDIFGTEGPDMFSVLQGVRNGIAYQNHHILSFPGGEPRGEVLIQGSGGNDSFDGRFAQSPMDFAGGGDDDTFVMGPGPNMTFTGSQGNDRLQFNLSSAADKFRLKQVGLVPTAFLGTQQIGMDGFEVFWVFGLGGNDTFKFDSIVQLNLTRRAPTAASKLAAVVHGGAGNDRINGSKAGDRLFGDSGIDTIYGKGGGDHILGGAGSDWLYGGPGDDRIAGQAAPDWLWGDAGNDILVGGPAMDRLWGGSGRNTLTQ